MAAADDGAGGWTDCFDGKLEAPAIGAGPLDEKMMAELASTGGTSGAPLAAWDLGVGPSPARVRSVRVAATHGYPDTTALDGECLNTPMRAVTGHCWNGREQDFRLDSEAYGAIHFHSDDLDDCRWAPSAIISLPPDLPTAVYAVRARGNDQVAHTPIFVRPTEPTSDIALLMPTASYLAYANDHPASDGQMSQAVASSTPVLRPRDMLLHEHREWGLSCYDRHVDGSGVAYSTRLRPLLNMAPTHRYHVGAWQLPADLALVSWLRQRPIDVDILTDDDLDLEGDEMLAPYGTILTGTHPEYYTTRMLDAVEGWLDDGGRLIYLGANGFYWRTAYDPDRPWMIEIRRGNAGSRAWESAPGEDHFAFTGERGGLWRHLGRAPQKLTGVGYAAQGFDLCGYYRLLPDSADPRAAFVFEGVESEVFGSAGTIGNGAAGQELDRFDADLGSAADALVLATSEGLSDGYLRCVEELNFSVSGTSALHDPKVRADLVYHVRSGGGAVFATGSIAWSGSLGVDPSIDRITTNVINRFRDPTPLEW